MPSNYQMMHHNDLAIDATGVVRVKLRRQQDGHNALLLEIHLRI
jgi:hypothetical protein